MIITHQVRDPRPVKDLVELAAQQGVRGLQAFIESWPDVPAAGWERRQKASSGPRWARSIALHEDGAAALGVAAKAIRDALAGEAGAAETFLGDNCPLKCLPGVGKYFSTHLLRSLVKAAQRTTLDLPGLPDFLRHLYRAAPGMTPHVRAAWQFLGGDLIRNLCRDLKVCPLDVTCLLCEGLRGAMVLADRSLTIDGLQGPTDVARAMEKQGLSILGAIVELPRPGSFTSQGSPDRYSEAAAVKTELGAAIPVAVDKECPQLIRASLAAAKAANKTRQHGGRRRFEKGARMPTGGLIAVLTGQWRKI